MLCSPLASIWPPGPASAATGRLPGLLPLLGLFLLAGCSNDPPAASAAHGQETAMPETTAPADLIVIDADDDPGLWLEEVEGDAALDWVRGENERSLTRLRGDPHYQELFAAALAIYQSEERIPYGRLRQGWVDNFWEDADRRHGLWRRASLESYLSGSPDWQPLLDLDALAAREQRNWVWRGADCRPGDASRCLLTLSDGGTDAASRREYDLDRGAFVADGFMTPEAKGNTAWIDADRLLVLLADDPAATTRSGYPFVARIWQRQQPLTEATEILRGSVDDVGLFGIRLQDSAGPARVLVRQAHSFFAATHWVLAEEQMLALPLPQQVDIEGLYRGQLLFSLDAAWTDPDGGEHEPGSLLSFDLDHFLRHGSLPAIRVAFRPDQREALRAVGVTAGGVLLIVDRDVTGRVELLHFDGDGWQTRAVGLPANLSLTLIDSDPEQDLAFIAAEGFLQPATLYAVDSRQAEARPIRSAPAWFDTDGLVVEQRQVTSADGTRVPYFLVRREDLPFDGSTPVWLYAYGGFQISMNPSYSGIRGRLWLERGGAFALANIRGGGEFGPAWHQAGLKTRRQRIYDDLIAVAEDLITTGVTSPARLAVDGRSNGGLLAGVMYTQRPDLFAAVISGVPLLDMLRYHRLLAGASWMGEYGDPDDAEEGAFLRRISPYHNVRRQGPYPEIFLYTSTLDDRVHPGHARKFAHLLAEAGHPYLYYENIEGGHAGAANLEDSAHRDAMLLQFLLQRLMDAEAAATP